jgi:shikimate dehydrogenase
LGRNISYHFRKLLPINSRTNYKEYTYENFTQDIAELKTSKNNHQELEGMNVTIPSAVMPFLDKLSKKAALIGAVNTIKFTKKGKLKGYNTDYYGFKKALKPLLQKHTRKH